MSSPKQGISDLPEICYRQGMRRVVISPGSRNAPLIFSFTRHGKMKCLSITDERSAAYFALGLSLQSQEPVGLICTSGTAALNFAPAIAEAFYENVPLIVMTADRPGEWIDQADGQTIRQREIYRNYIKQSYEMPTETAVDSDLWFFNRSVNEALNSASQEPKGPVHLNIPLREPLYSPLPEPGNELQIIQTTRPTFGITPEELAQLQFRWNTSSKKMIVFGADVKNEATQKVLPLLLNDRTIVILAENISNLSNENMIAAPERFFASLNEAESSLFQPDLLITVGHSIVSGQLKKYLRQYQPGEHWHIRTSPSYIDTFQGLTRSIIAIPGALLTLLTENGDNSEFKYRDILLEKEISFRSCLLYTSPSPRD